MAGDKDATQAAQLPQLKPEPKGKAQFFRGAAINPPMTEPVDQPDGAVMMLPNGDWCDQEAALLVLKAEGNRAANKSVRGTFSEVNGGGGASARERSLRDIYRLLQRGDMKGVSRKLYGHDKATWFRLTDIKHPETRTVSETGEDVRVEVQWDNEE